MGTDDGWYHISDTEQHYFFQGHSLCKEFETVPIGAHHDNDPKLHCKVCEQQVNKLLAVADSIVGKKLTTKEIIKLLELLDTIDLKKGSSAKVKTGESCVAVIRHENNKVTTVTAGIKKKGIFKK